MTIVIVILTRVVSGDFVVGRIGPTLVVTAAVGRIRGIGTVAVVGEEDEQSEADDLKDQDEDTEFRALRSHGVGPRCHLWAVLSGRCVSLSVARWL